MSTAMNIVDSPRRTSFDVAGLAATLVDPTRISSPEEGSAGICLDSNLFRALEPVIAAGWTLLLLAPASDSSIVDATPPVEGPTCAPRPIPTRPDFGGRAQRVHTALTEREREVLSLVAGGATNRAIGSRLFISPKTASVHVSRILTKLNAATRTEAAALAHASGLVESPADLPRVVNA